MNVFITLNPHIENLSRNKLIKDFRFILLKYYRKVLGPRYYKHKDKQYKIGIFQEDGFSEFISYDDLYERAQMRNKKFIEVLENIDKENLKKLKEEIKKC